MPLTRYRVNGEIDRAFNLAVEAGIQAHAFKQIDSPDVDIVGFGWVSQGDFSDTSFDNAMMLMPAIVALSLRIDTVRIPSRTLELALKEATENVLRETGQSRLSSAQRRELKERVRETLRKKTLPTIQVHDIVWDVTNRVLYLTSISRNVMNHVESLFKKSFPGLTLTPLIPYIRAEETLADEMLERLQDLKPMHHYL
jgi:DNA recombination-dependent growth factor C